MGDARRRGTYEERKAASIAALAGALDDTARLADAAGLAEQHARARSNRELFEEAHRRRRGLMKISGRLTLRAGPAAGRDLPGTAETETTRSSPAAEAAQGESPARAETRDEAAERGDTEPAE